MGRAPAITEYEKLRLLNIAKNQAKLLELGVQEVAADVRKAASERKRKRPEKGAKAHVASKAKPAGEPIVIRRSLRTQGIAPEGSFAGGIVAEQRDGSVTLKGSPKPDQRHSGVGAGGLERIYGPVSLRTTSGTPEEDDAFLDVLRSCREGGGIVGEEGGEAEQSCSRRPALLEVDFSQLALSEDDVAKVVKDRIFQLAFLHTRAKVIAAAGDKSGQVGLWDADVAPEAGGGDGVHVYQPHSRPVSGMACSPWDCSKLYTCSFDGTARVLDINQSAFLEVSAPAEPDEVAASYSALALSPESPGVLFLGDADGGLAAVDTRAAGASGGGGGALPPADLHTRKVNAIDFNPERPFLMATGSTDATVCLWDVRRVGGGGKRAPEPIASGRESKGVNAAAFSPDGSQLACTSYDNHVSVWSGMLELAEGRAPGPAKRPLLLPKAGRIPHNNNTGRWLSTFRAVWSWDSRHLVIGSMGRAVDVLSPATCRAEHSLTSEHLTTVPARCALHPLLPLLAGGNASGRVHIFR